MPTMQTCTRCRKHLSISEFGPQAEFKTSNRCRSSRREWVQGIRNRQSLDNIPLNIASVRSSERTQGRRKTLDRSTLTPLGETTPSDQTASPIYKRRRKTIDSDTDYVPSSNPSFDNDLNMSSTSENLSSLPTLNPSQEQSVSSRYLKRRRD
jgi:hypothetical protein